MTNYHPRDVYNACMQVVRGKKSVKKAADNWQVPVPLLSKRTKDLAKKTDYVAILRNNYISDMNSPRRNRKLTFEHEERLWRYIKMMASLHDEVDHKKITEVATILLQGYGDKEAVFGKFWSRQFIERKSQETARLKKRSTCYPTGKLHKVSVKAPVEIEDSDSDKVVFLGHENGYEQFTFGDPAKSDHTASEGEDDSDESSIPGMSDLEEDTTRTGFYEMPEEKHLDKSDLEFFKLQDDKCDPAHDECEELRHVFCKETYKPAVITEKSGAAMMTWIGTLHPKAAEFFGPLCQPWANMIDGVVKETKQVELAKKKIKRVKT